MRRIYKTWEITYFIVKSYKGYMKDLIVRQGDVVIKSIDSIPSSAKKQESNVLVYGESTGHKHALVGGDVLMDKNTMYLLLTKKGKIVHEEHKAIDLPVGKYVVVRQREYMNKDAVKIVQD